MKMWYEKSTIVKDDQFVQIPDGASLVKMYHQFNIDTQKEEYVLLFSGIETLDPQ